MRSLARTGLLAALAAAVVNVVVYYGARAAGVPMELTETFEDHFARMKVSSFVFASLLDGGLTATLTAMACRRWAPRPRSWFVTLAVLGLIGSLALPITSDGTTATIVVLSITHVLTAAIIVPPLARTLSPRSTPALLPGAAAR